MQSGTISALVVELTAIAGNQDQLQAEVLAEVEAVAGRPLTVDERELVEHAATATTRWICETLKLAVSTA